MPGGRYAARSPARMPSATMSSFAEGASGETPIVPVTVALSIAPAIRAVALIEAGACSWLADEQSVDVGAMATTVVFTGVAIALSDQAIEPSSRCNLLS